MRRAKGIQGTERAPKHIKGKFDGEQGEQKAYRRTDIYIDSEGSKGHIRGREKLPTIKKAKSKETERYIRDRKEL